MTFNRSYIGSKEMLAQLEDIQGQMKFLSKNATGAKPDTKSSFSQHLMNEIKDVDKVQKDANKMANDLVTGKNQNIHETMLRATQAELNFNMLVQVRNKVLEAYQEIMRMPI